MVPVPVHFDAEPLPAFADVVVRIPCPLDEPVVIDVVELEVRIIEYGLETEIVILIGMGDHGRVQPWILVDVPTAPLEKTVHIAADASIDDDQLG